MNNNDDVKPLLQSEQQPDSDLLVRVLEARTGHEPSNADLAGLTKKLAAILPPGTLPPTTPSGGPPPPPPATPAAAAGGAAKAMIATLAIGVAAVVGVAITRAPSSTKPAAPATAPTASVSSSTPPSDPSPPAFPTAMTSNEVPSPPPPVRSVRAPAAPPPPPPETTMLAGAHEQLLRGSPERALSMTNEHLKAYPHGSLAQEREVIAIEALVKLGRRDEATKRAAQFHKSFPQSSHGERIDRLVK